MCIYLFITMLGLHWCTQAFSTCGIQGLVYTCDMWASHSGGFSWCGLLMVGASHGGGFSRWGLLTVRTSHGGGFSWCGLLMVGASLVAEHGF